MDKTLIDAIHDHRHRLEHAVDKISWIAENLASVGLEKPCDQLLSAIEGLKESCKEISAAHAIELNGQISHSEEMIGGMLKLVLDGRITLKEKSKKNGSSKSV